MRFRYGISDVWSSYLKSTSEFPAGRPSPGAFSTAFLETEKRNRVLIDSSVKGRVDKGNGQARSANVYKAYIDTKAIDAAGMKPVQADLARFDAIADKAALSKVLGEQVRADVDPLNATDYRTENLFGIFVTQGLATPGAVLPYKIGREACRERVWQYGELRGIVGSVK